jgi:glycosyltransferase involved in cell wall biosynthesis
MMHRPRVSVIMAAYNCGRFIDEGIRSVTNQTFSSWELIVVDDGSTDNTAEIIQTWAAADSRVRSFWQPNSGRPACPRNRGIAEARGEVITFLDGDDLYHPQKLLRQVRVLDQYPDVGAVYHDYHYFADGTDPGSGMRYLERDRFFQRAGRWFTSATLGDDLLYLGTPDLIKFMSCDSVGIHTSTIAVRRSVLQSIDQPPFDETLPHGEDVHLWLRIALQTRVAALSRPLSYYRYHPDSWMTSTPRPALALGRYSVKSHSLRRLERLLSREEWPDYQDRIARYWNGLAYDSLVAGLLPQAREGFREGFRTANSLPLRWRAVKGLIVAALPRRLVRAYWRVRRGGEFEARRSPVQ